MAAARKKDAERHIRVIEQFYEVLLEAAGNAMMSVYLQSLRSRLARLRSFSLSQRNARRSASARRPD